MSDDFLTPKKVAAVLAEHGLRPDKRFGQNFLVDRAILEKIVRAAELRENDSVIEVGAGLGALTRELARHAGSVVSIELDQQLEPYLRAQFQGMANVRMLFGDALTLDLTDAMPANKLVANLPYNVATPLFTRVLESYPSITDLYFLVQKEVAQRITASPGKKDYGFFTVKCGLFGQGVVLFNVSPGSFFPPPKVVSSFVHFKRYEAPLASDDERERVIALAEGAFANRRKKALNSLLINLSDALGRREWLETVFTEAGISSEVRAENISILEFIELARCMFGRERIDRGVKDA